MSIWFCAVQTVKPLFCRLCPEPPFSFFLNCELGNISIGQTQCWKGENCISLQPSGGKIGNNKSRTLQVSEWLFSAIWVWLITCGIFGKQLFEGFPEAHYMGSFLQTWESCPTHTVISTFPIYYKLSMSPNDLQSEQQKLQNQTKSVNLLSAMNNCNIAISFNVEF